MISPDCGRHVLAGRDGVCVSELASYATGSISAGTATHARFESFTKQTYSWSSRLGLEHEVDDPTPASKNLPS